MNRKNLLFLLLVGTFVSTLGFAGTLDTLRNYNPKKLSSSGYASYTYYPFSSYPTQIQRFDMKAPGYIKSIIVKCGGTAGTLRMHLYGHEGGAPSPQLMKDVVPSVAITKTPGTKTITYTYPNPVWMDNNQFYVGFDSLTPGTSSMEIGAIGTLQDSVAPYCVSSTGGAFYGQWITDTGGNQGYDIYGYFVDVVVDEPETVSPNYLKDVTAAAGISTTLSNWSVAWGDYNNDDFQDLMVSGTLYKNNGNGTFTDVTTSAGIGALGGQVTNGFVDMNNDGNLDIVCLIGGTHKLFINNGSGSFTSSSLNLAANFIDISSMNFGDIDKDGYPDMFIGQLWNGYPNPLPNYFYYNTKSNGFRDSTSTFPGCGSRHSRGSSFVDYDNDGDLDLYIANYYNVIDELWRNNGDGTFTDVTIAKSIDYNGFGLSSHGVGVDWSDYDNDGDMDLLLPQLCHQSNMLTGDARPTSLYNNTGAPNYDFTDLYSTAQHSTTVGIQYEETHAGAAWGDVNADGLMDFAICTFYGCRYADLYIQQPDHTFKLATYDYMSTNITTADDMCWADYDGDGKLDLAFANNGIFALYRNTAPTGNLVEIDARSTSANKYAIGSHVTVYSGGQTYMQEVKAGRGDRQQNPYRLFFGLGTNTSIDSVVIKWPNNNKDKFTGLNINRTYKLTEGGTVQVGTHELAKAESKLSVYPNPFTNETMFNYSLTENTTVKIEVYSLMGELVTVIQDGAQTKGEYAITWDGTNAAGAQLNNGIYIYKMSGGDFVKSGKVVLQK